MGIQTKTTSKIKGKKQSANTNSSRKNTDMAQSDTTSQPQTSSSNNIGSNSSLCKVCNLIVSDEHNHNALFCDYCCFGVHIECSGVTAKQFELINSIAGRACKGMRWFCPSCQDKPIQEPGSNQKDDLRITAIEKVCQDMKSQMDQIYSVLSESAKTKVETKIKTQVEEVLNDHREGENKKTNIILFNLPETNSETDPENEDLKRVKEVVSIMNKDVGTEALHKDNVSRLGKRRPQHKEKPRPVKITFNNEETKWKVLRKSYKLKNDNSYRSVVAANDKTAKELQEDKVLKAELEEAKKARPGEDLMIYKRQIINRKDRPSYADIVRNRSDPGASKLAPSTAGNSDSSQS